MAKKHGTRTVLIIEDEAEIRHFASRVLELEGYHVIQAEDGCAGIKAVRENPVALILLDLRMPGRNGWALMEEMKNEPALSVIPVIVFTSMAGVAGRERALSMGAADYLVKPLSAAGLRESVARILCQRKD